MILIIEKKKKEKLNRHRRKDTSEMDSCDHINVDDSILSRDEHYNQYKPKEAKAHNSAPMIESKAIEQLFSK